jgi:hypothetical protein
MSTTPELDNDDGAYVARETDEAGPELYESEGLA